MRGRREFFLGAASLGLGGFGFFSGCSKATRNVTAASHAGVDFKVLVPKKDADDKYPLFVAIHGLGGAPEHWVEPWGTFPGKVQIALPRGFDKHEEGHSWFPWTTNMKDEKLATHVVAAEERLWKGIAALAAGRKIVVAGYEQGALLSYVIAVRHADAVLASFPVAGACPEGLFPKDKTKAAPIIAFHATADDVVSLTSDRASVDAFKAQGNRAELREYPGVKHSPSDKLHADLNDEILTALEAK